MKKLIFVLLLNAYLFSCTGQGCISHGSNCYGLGCISHGSNCYGLGCIANRGSCYGDNCIANGGSGHGRNCISNGSLNCNSLPQSIIDQYPDVVFTIEQRSAKLQQQLANLQQQLANTPVDDFIARIKLHIQILNLQNQIDPNAILSNLTTTLNTIKALIPTPVPANLEQFSNEVNSALQQISPSTARQSPHQSPQQRNQFNRQMPQNQHHPEVLKNIVNIVNNLRRMSHSLR